MSEDSSNKPDDTSNYVLVVDSHGDVDILQVSYETKWKDLCVMLQVKFEYETLPVFTYTDDEEDIICLDTQESLDEALKVCKRNADVLHIQMRRSGVPPPQMQRMPSNQEETRRPVLTRDHIEMARAAMGNTIGWAANAVKSAFSRSTSGVSSDSITENACKDPVSTDDIPMEPLTVQDPEPILHEVDPSFQTNVKEVMDSQSGDISVSTTGLCDSDNDDSEVVVKEPISPTCSTRKSQSESHVDPNMLETIKEEVRSAITKELRTLREEVNVMTQSFTFKPAMEQEIPCTSRDDTEEPRSPAVIKADMKKLRQEMREAKNYRKMKKQNEKTLMKKRVSGELDVLSPDSTSTGPAKKVRKYAASFICENLLDGSCVGVKQQFVKYWVLKNEGTIVWDHQIELRLIDETLSDDSSSVDPRTDEQATDRRPPVGEGSGPEKISYSMPIVESGSTTVIAVTHMSPSMPCIYTSEWRLCHDGKFFGPRSSSDLFNEKITVMHVDKAIWCKVAVKSGMEVTRSNSDQSLSEQSYVSEAFAPARKISTEEHNNADDDLSNMLSFEMTAVGDFNKETANIEQNNSYNFSVSYPTQKTQLQQDHPSEITEEEVELAQADPAPVLEEEITEPVLTSLPEETLEQQATGQTPEEQAEELIKEQDEEQLEDVEFHDVEEEPSELNMDDTHSDVPSDFEVIPLPECFDTTKPLSPTDKAKEEAESVREHLSSLNMRPKEDVEDGDDSLPPPPPMEDENEEEHTIEEESKQEEPQSEVSKEQLPEPSSLLEASSSRDKSVAPSCLPVPQSVLDQDKPAPESMVQDYATGYETPIQKTAPPQEPWVPQPIPLPRGVLEADKIWTKKDQGEAAPSPQPRSSTSAGDNSVVAQTARTDAPAIDVSEEIDSPQICFPPETEDVDEFTLAPETPSDGSSTAILVPPGYPVPPPTIPSLVAVPQPPQNVLLPPQNHEPSLMEQLVDMGFLDIDLNEKLIAEFQGDMTKIVHVLLHPRPNPSTHHRRHDRRYPGAYLA